MATTSSSTVKSVAAGTKISSIGTVKSIVGTVTATDANGVTRTLQVGDKVFANDVIQTSAAGAILIEFLNGKFMDLGRDSKIALDSDVFNPAEAGAAQSDIAAIQAQIAAGADPTQITEATAAGAGGGEEGGASFVVVDQAAPQGLVTSGFPTGPISTSFEQPTGELPFVEPEPVIPTNTPPTVGSGSATVSEEGLPERGIPDDVGVNDTTDEIVATGQIPISDANGDPLTVTLSAPTDPLASGGQPITWSGDGTPGNPLVGSIAVGEGETIPIIEIEIDGSGNYTVTLLGSIDHLDDSVEDQTSFTVGVNVSDGSETVTGSLLVTIEDDGPTLMVRTDVSESDQEALMVNVDETVGDERLADGEIDTDGNTDDAPDVLGQVTTELEGGLLSLFAALGGDYGADGPGSTSDGSFSFVGFPDSGELATTLEAIEGGAITLVRTSDTLLTGEDEDGDAVFTIEIVNVGTDDAPVYQLQTTLNEALVHTDDPDLFDEAVQLLLAEDGAVQLQYEVTREDADGDTVTDSATVDLISRSTDGEEVSNTSYFSFDDDGPTLTVEANPEADLDALMVNVDETVGDERLAEGEIDTDGNTDDAPDVLGQVTTELEGGLLSLFAALGGDFGSDGPGSDSGSFSFAGFPDSGELATTLEAIEGGAITLVRTSDTLLTGEDEDGDAVFTIEIVNVGTDDAPVYQLQTTLNEALVHTDDPDLFDEAVQLLLAEDGAVQLQYEVTREDADGDTVTDSATVDLISRSTDGEEVSNTSYFSFDDDGPTLTVEANPEADLDALMVNVDETVGDERLAEGEIDTDGNTDDAPDVLGQVTTELEGGLLSLFAALGGDFGSDGPGSDSGSFSFVGFPDSGELATTLEAIEGGAITLVRTSDTLLTGEDEDGDAVFTIEIVNVGTDDAPVYQLQTTLNEALVHTDDPDLFDEAVQLLLAEDGAVQLQYEVTREDADGDTVTDSATVDLISRSTDGEEVSNTSYFSFDDDGPTLTVEANPEADLDALMVNVDETVGDERLAEGEIDTDGNTDDAPDVLGQVTTELEGGLLSLFAALGGDFGSDGPGSDSGSFSFAGFPDSGELATTLEAIEGGAITLVRTSDTLLTGEDEDGDAVFTIEIVNVGTDDAPVYQLQTTLNEALVHTDDPDLFDEAVQLLLAEDGAVQLQYEVTREDADGDTVTDSATVDLISRSTDGEEVSNTSYFSFDDDGPTLTVEANPEADLDALMVNVDETVGDERLAEGEIDTDGNTDDAPDVLGQVTTELEGGLLSLFAALGGDFGSDGPGSDSGSFSFAGFPDSGELATTLEAIEGGAITLVRTSDTLLTGEDEDGDAVFTIEIVNVGTDDAPVYQLQTTLNEALVHPDNATFDEAVSLWLAEDGAVQLQYEVTREDADGDTVTDSATVDLISRSTDGEEVSNTSYFSFDDDGPTDFYPDTIYTVLGVESPLPEPVTIQSGLNFAMAAGSDGVGTANFNFNLETEESQPFLDADGKQLYMNNEELFISYDPDFDDHQHIIVKTEDGNVAMTGEINADGDVVITMFSGTFISNTKITTVTDLAGIGGGDVPFKGLNIGTKQDPDPDGTNDVLVSSAIRPLGDGDEGSVNSNANELGVGEGNELSNGEIIRYDLVTGLSVNNQQNNESYSFTGYQQTFAFKQTIVVAGESKDADFKLRIYNESGSATNQDVTLVGTSLSTEQRMLTPEEIIIRDGDGVIQDNDLHVAQDGSGLILYDIGNDWTFEIKSVDATDTPEAFNVVEIEAIEAEMVDGTLVLSDETTTSFKLGEFSYGEDTELSPVTIELPVIATDGDGDAVTSDVQLVVYPDTISMVGTDSGETMTGDANANYMFGEGGDDILVGNGGDDILSGDGGNDTFVFNGSSLTEAGSATITDFTLGDPATNPEADILDISDVLLAAHASDSDIPTDLAAAISGGFLKVEVVDGNTAQIVLDFDGSSGGTGSVIPIVTLDNLSAGYDANTLLSTLLGDGDHQLK